MKLLKTVWLISLVLLLNACSPHKHKMETLKNDSYLFKGKNFTYAIYNEDSKLINHPLIDLNNEIRRRGVNNKITDLYIVSHGWNFTASEARTNYHNYIDLINQSQPNQPTF